MRKALGPRGALLCSTSCFRTHYENLGESANASRQPARRLGSSGDFFTRARSERASASMRVPVRRSGNVHAIPFVTFLEGGWSSSPALHEHSRQTGRVLPLAQMAPTAVPAPPAARSAPAQPAP